MANAKQLRSALDRKLGRLRKASESLEARLKSAAKDVTTGALALEQVLEKEVAPNVAAKLRTIEKELTVYKKAADRELSRLTKSYATELVKLKRARDRIAKKASKSTPAKPAAKARAKAKPVARKATAKKTAAQRTPKPAARKAKSAAKKPAKAAARKAAKTAARKPRPKATSKPARKSAARTRKKPAAK